MPGQSSKYRDMLNTAKQRYRQQLQNIYSDTDHGEPGMNGEAAQWGAWYQIPGENHYLGVGQGSTVAGAMESAARAACTELMKRGYQL
ncbi:hypothetical protein M408DRAFT_331004, partial [Serendipita vermifera MAFF 305830]